MSANDSHHSLSILPQTASRYNFDCRDFTSSKSLLTERRRTRIIPRFGPWRLTSNWISQDDWYVPQSLHSIAHNVRVPPHCPYLQTPPPASLTAIYRRQQEALGCTLLTWTSLTSLVFYSYTGRSLRRVFLPKYASFSTSLRRPLFSWPSPVLIHLCLV